MVSEDSIGIATDLPWPQTPAQAIALQRELAGRVLRVDDVGSVRRVAGVDVGFPGGGQIARAAVAVLSFPDLRPVEQAVAELPVAFPYVPGLLSFRELPAVLAALAGLAELPDLLLVDGQGLAHPRRFGIACHLGVLTGLPTIGVAKTRLVGAHDPVPDRRGAWVPLHDRGEVIGAVLRSRVGVRPIYVSVGHRLSLERAVEWVMACTGRYRLPQTTRAAHALASTGA
ncbi:deoxyribonuclease V [Immundisolibacter cernigliae]|uniref:Endonuclease V n=1 Tax=Immundisolibacter cernigliae TaxID=1810504 RepID=A0A1B1YRM6_9GAMM|nr:deoxyribonuclease V [Immundisolibacter cernigliae]ANX03435.1 endonuclease V [Immundisolibacter cernigliae]